MNVISNSLSTLTYNADRIKLKDDQPNIYMGIGLWSVKDGLSEGLPVDVMHMLLTAALMRSKIEESTKQPSKVIILIANSMAAKEGADEKKLAQIVKVYKRSLKTLLELLNIRECTEIVLSSQLEEDGGYKKALEEVEESPRVQKLKIEDEAHYKYIRTQTAITRYMDKHRNVGVKVGWLSGASINELNDSTQAQYLKNWDELKFDRWCDAICPDSTIQYVYAKSGKKQPKTGQHINIIDACPYTAYSKDQRYIVDLQGGRDIKTICPIQKQVVRHWQGVAEICEILQKADLVNANIIPTKCIDVNNTLKTVYNLLNHWSNPPAVRKL